MSDNYWIIRVNHLQKVCYIILGDVPGFKVLKAVDEIKSYFGKNNVDISTSWFAVSLNMYEIWLRLFVAEDLIDMNTGKDSVFDVMEIKSYATSVKYELEIEPHASIRSYTCDIPEIAENLFNEWFNDDSQSDKRKEKEMSDNTVSPTLSKIAERIKQLKQLERDSGNVAFNIQKHKNAIKELTFKLDELGEDILHVRDRIGDLCSQAMIKEGFTEEYLSRFLKEHGFEKQ